MFNLALFDWDGTAIDSEPYQAQSFIQAFQEVNVEFTQAMFDECVYGCNFQAAGEKLLRHGIDTTLYTQVLGRKRVIYQEMMKQEEALFPELMPLLDSLAANEVRLGLVTSSVRQMVIPILERYHLVDRFQLIVCADDCHRFKPDPYPYQMALEYFGTSAAQAVALEDSPNGITSAKAAGLPVWVAPPLPKDYQELINFLQES